MDRVLLSVLLAPVLASAADYDVLIRNARVIDGSGNPGYRASLAIKDGRIAAIGALPDATATRAIDAAGRVLAPGFIDPHTHVEGNLERSPRAANFLLDGVTTVITGNCGSSELNLKAWFDKLTALGIGINVASLVGHNSVRREVMGAANRQATPAEIRAMQSLVDHAMRDGAVGFSTGLEYVPGTYANTAEVVALAKAAAAHGGVYTSHMRDEGIREIEAITEAVQVGKEAGMPVEISHLKIDRRSVWGASEKSLALIEKYPRRRRRRGRRPVPLRPRRHQSRHPPSLLGAGRRQDQGAPRRPCNARKNRRRDEAEPRADGRARLQLRHRRPLRPRTPPTRANPSPRSRP